MNDPNMLLRLAAAIVFCSGKKHTRHPVSIRMDYAGPAQTLGDKPKAKFVCPLCGAIRLVHLLEDEKLKAGRAVYPTPHPKKEMPWERIIVWVIEISIIILQTMTHGVLA